MCGLSGIASTNLTEIDIDKAEFLALLSTYRGMHSTGMFYSQKQLTDKIPIVGYFKEVSAPFNYITGKGWQEKRKQIKNGLKVLSFHTRHATVGKVNVSNAHPFRSSSKRILGMHNGTLTKVKETGYIEKFGTDSEALINFIGEVGFEEALKKTSGAYALVWADYHDGTLNMIRNFSRPLSYMKHHNDFFWASEGWMLKALRAKHSMFEDMSKIVELPVHTLLTLPLDMRTSNFELTKINGLEAPVSQTWTYSRQSTFWDGSDWEGSSYSKWWENRSTETSTGTEVVKSDPVGGDSDGSKGDNKPHSEGKTEDSVEESRKPSKAGGVKQTRDQEVIPIGPQLSSNNSSNSKDRTHSGHNVVYDARKLIEWVDEEDVDPQLQVLLCPEQKRINKDGDIEVQTSKGVFESAGNFILLLEDATCEFSGELSSLSDERIWITSDAFVLKTYYDQPGSGCREAVNSGLILSTMVRRQPANNKVSSLH